MAAGVGSTPVFFFLSWLMYGFVKFQGSQVRLNWKFFTDKEDKNMQTTANTITRLSLLDELIKKTQSLHDLSTWPARTAKIHKKLSEKY